MLSSAESEVNVCIAVNTSTLFNLVLCLERSEIS